MSRNVRDHGAIGNGITDDTATIQAAIAAAGDAEDLYFPKGTYSVTSLTWGDYAQVRATNALLVATGTLTFGISNTFAGLSFDLQSASVAGAVPQMTQNLGPQYFNRARAQALIDTLGILNLGFGNFELGSGAGLGLNGLPTAIKGCGPQWTRIQYGGSGTAVHANANNTATECVIEDFSIVGAATTVQSSVGFGVGRASGSPLSAQVWMNRVWVEDFDTGWEIFSAQICRFRDFKIENCKSYGIREDAGTRSTQCDFDGGKIRRCGIGIKLEKCDGMKFDTVDVEGCTGPGLLIDSAGAVGSNFNKNITFLQCWFEGNQTAFKGTGVAQVVLDSTALKIKNRRVHFITCNWGSINAADYHVECALGEEFFQVGCEFAGQLKLKSPQTASPPSAGTHARLRSPLVMARAWFGSEYQVIPGVWLHPDGATSIRAHNGDVIVVNNTSATTITEMEATFASTIGDVKPIHVLDARTTFEHGTGNSGDKAFRLPGGQNFTPTAGTVLWFYLAVSVGTPKNREWIYMGSDVGGEPS